MPKGFFKENGKTKPISEKKGISETQLGGSSSTTGHLINVDPKNNKNFKSEGHGLPDIQIREDNWGIKIENGKINHLVLGNLTNAGWYWTSHQTNKEDDLAGFIDRIAKGEDISKEFIKQMEENGVTLEIIKPLLIKSIKTGNGNYEVSGDNSRWRFGEDEPDLESFLDGYEKLEKLSEEKQSKVKERVWRYFETDFEEFNKQYGKQLIENYVGLVKESGDWDYLLSELQDIYALDAEEYFGEYQFNKLGEAVGKAIEDVEKLEK